MELSRQQRPINPKGGRPLLTKPAPASWASEGLGQMTAGVRFWWEPRVGLGRENTVCIISQCGGFCSYLFSKMGWEHGSMAEHLPSMQETLVLSRPCPLPPRPTGHGVSQT